MFNKKQNKTYTCRTQMHGLKLVEDIKTLDSNA